MAKLGNRVFAAFLEERAARRDGYILGAVGQDPKKMSDWYYSQYTGEQREKALFWKRNAERVWDCQGLVEGYINDRTGSRLNVRARDNYATWCDPKGAGAIPEAYKRPGAAVFIHSGGAISHVGFLVRPAGGDWLVVEARGVMHGVVTTKLSGRPWNRWGLMTRYFDYGAQPPALNLGDRALVRGMSGDDVRQLQGALIEVGYDCGKWGADGEFGAATEAALKAFQTSAGLAADGIAGESTVAALREAKEKPEAAAPARGNVLISGGDAYMRLGPGVHYAASGIARAGERYARAEAGNWVPVEDGGEVRWISGKYAKGVEE